jgi:hypothetical protein
MGIWIKAGRTADLPVAELAGVVDVVELAPLRGASGCRLRVRRAGSGAS